MRLTPLAAGPATSPFAHLARPAPAAAAPRAAEEDKKEKDKPAGEDDKKKPDAEEDKKKPDAEDPKECPESTSEEDDPEMADGDDDSDRDDDGNPETRKARGRERGRIRAILLSEPGKANPVGAAHLACGTAMSRKQAIEMLAAIGPAPAAAAPEPKKDALRDRMATVETPRVTSGDPASAPTLAQQIIAAGKKRRNES
jgi:hypothetical protein